MDNNQQLRALMNERSLSRKRAAELSGYSLASVDRWLLPTGNNRYIDMPDRALKLMLLELESARLHSPSFVNCEPD